MGVRVKIPSIFGRYVEDRRGAFSLIWAISMMGVLLSVGSGYDLAQLTKAKALAQYAADNMALSASIAVDLNNDDRFVQGQSYPYAEIGAGGVDFTGSMTGSVQYDIVDDMDTGNTNLPESDKSRLLARATVGGTYRTAFMGIIPGLTTLDFTATSDVAYSAREGTPASIFFVVDNSGSMDSYDDNHVKKIYSLRASMKDFMDTLSTISVHGDDIFRTALYPYNTNLIYSKKVDPIWDTLSDYKIDQMYAQGGTKSTNALSRARSKFTLENQIHDNENGHDDPLKFLIFMSDGANNGATTQQQCTTEQFWVNGTAEYWWRWKNGYKKYKYNEPTYKPWKWTHVQGTSGHYENQQVCQQVPYSPVNEASLTECTSMKNNGVTIYSIAYDVASHERAMAEAFMKACSSGEADYYKYASNGTDLQAVFDEIGESVVTEVVRIKH